MLPKATPLEAAGLFALDLLPSSAMPELALRWLTEGMDTPTMRILAGESSPIMSEVAPLFTATLEELSVAVPGRIAVTMMLLEAYVRRIATGALDPYEGMARIDQDLADCSVFPDAKYVGDGLGLERMYTWYREIQDLEDGTMLLYYTDLPREEAGRRFREHLVEEAQQRLKGFET